MKGYFLVLGTLLGGSIAHYFQQSIIFFILSTLSIISILPVFFLQKVAPTTVASNKHSYLFFQGIKYLITNKRILSLSLLSIGNQSISQFTNIMLPLLVLVVLNADSMMYGIIESAWSFGGLLVSLIFVVYIKNLNINYLFIALATTSFLMAAVPNINNTWAIILLHFLFGFIVTSLSIGSFASISKSCSDAMLGRVLQNTSALTSLCGLIIYTLPVFWSGMEIKYYYYMWAALTLIFSIICFIIFSLGKRLS